MNHHARLIATLNQLTIIANAATPISQQVGRVRDVQLTGVSRAQYCSGGGHDTSADGNAEIKKAFDECKMQLIKTAVFKSYPQQNDAMQNAVWMKYVEKINTDVKYLFKVSMKKP